MTFDVSIKTRVQPKDRALAERQWAEWRASRRHLLKIGALAEATGMSKSGVFAHFGSREELQISVVREYHARFQAAVFEPAMREPLQPALCRSRHPNAVALTYRDGRRPHQRPDHRP